VRARNLLLAGGVVVAAGVVAVSLLSLEGSASPPSFTSPSSSGRSAAPHSGSRPADLSSPGVQSPPDPTNEEAVSSSEGNPSLGPAPAMRGYALPVAELAGLPGDAPPGTQLELWVTWDPPVTDGPRLQRLIPRVVLEKIAPAVTSDGPDAAILLVPEKKLPDLVYADRYGAISVAMLVGNP
jgi:hypothetical protein